MEDNKNDFTKLSVKVPTKVRIDVLAATRQRKVYELVAEMLRTWELVDAGDSVVVDAETDMRALALCETYEVGKNALIKKLVNAEYNKLAAVKLVEPIENTNTQTAQA